MRSLAAAVGAAAALAGCGGDDDSGGYPQEAVDSFIAECRSQPSASARDCRCVIERLEETLPYEQFADADEALAEGREPPRASLEKLEAAVRACGAV